MGDNGLPMHVSSGHESSLADAEELFIDDDTLLLHARRSGQSPTPIAPRLSTRSTATQTLSHPSGGS